MVRFVGCVHRTLLRSTDSFVILFAFVSLYIPICFRCVLPLCQRVFVPTFSPTEQSMNIVLIIFHTCPFTVVYIYFEICFIFGDFFAFLLLFCYFSRANSQWSKFRMDCTLQENKEQPGHHVAAIYFLFFAIIPNIGGLLSPHRHVLTRLSSSPCDEDYCDP